MPNSKYDCTMLYTVAYATKQGDRFLSCLSSFCCGDRFLGYFDLTRGSAMPMSWDHAVMLRDHFRKYLGGYDFVVVPVPWAHAPTEEVSGDG